MDNTIKLIGNLTRDVELRYLPSGQAVGTTSIAVNKRRKDAGGEWKNEGHFFDLTLWGPLAEHAAESLAKGTRVIATGRAEQERWETKEGQNRSKVVFVCDDIAVSLRWAPIEFTAGQPSGGGSKPAPAHGAQPPAYDPDSEPF